MSEESPPYRVESDADREHMAEALRLAANGLYDTKPNPAVGCVIVKDGRVIARGWTAPPGGPHAERVALAAAGADARGATVYCTLEPCNHQGRTGPCTRALIDAKVARVVFAGSDPNPLARGGARELEAAGIRVSGGVLAAEAEPLNRGFFTRMRRGAPWVRVKIAATLDGRTALANGASRWITGPAARADVHRWRARAGAILTGSGTVLADDPRLDARREEAGIEASLGIKQPLRAIVDSRLVTPRHAKVLGSDGAVVFTTATADAATVHRLEAAGARVERVAAGADGHVGLPAVLARLAALDVNDVWVEAGAGLNGALLAAGLIDELIVYIAPKLFGAGARGMFAVPHLSDVAQGWTVAIEDVRNVGDDLRIVGRPSRVAHA
ncbi:MAG TPA: bifunctional diaminohydroxyphosphoribosylaminopyrimidine deaminase/5-amino-6-(5-phosphoribosylamino)uracil reductase RibD [Gammaproteobacteria bacterium]|nr:bifunctional diaminohydroxyphosphoribosylaminopyrimidine deaminase/5-amino-6-(5-phosphoribosylamino)uracil reductase RibD [Gammaproteobacteria bacterium]